MRLASAIRSSIRSSILSSIRSSILLCGFMCVFIAGRAVAEPGAGSVAVLTACDSSPAWLDARARKLHGQIARRAATETLHRTGIAARSAGVATRQLDVSVTRWRVASAGGRADVTAEIRIVLCDRAGRMLSIANGKATATGDHARLAELREQAIAEGVGHLVGDLVARLGAQLAQAGA